MRSQPAFFSFSLITAIFCCLFLGSLTAQTSTNGLAKRLFYSLKYNDAKAFIKLVPTEKEVQKRINRYGLMISSEVLKKKLINEYETRISKVLSGFNKVRNSDGNKSEINWENAKIEEIVRNRKDEQFNGNIFKVYQILIDVSSSQSHFIIEIPKCARNNGKWKIVQEINISALKN